MSTDSEPTFIELPEFLVPLRIVARDEEEEEVHGRGGAGGDIAFPFEDHPAVQPFRHLRRMPLAASPL